MQVFGRSFLIFENFSETSILGLPVSHVLRYETPYILRYCDVLYTAHLLYMLIQGIIEPYTDNIVFLIICSSHAYYLCMYRAYTLNMNTLYTVFLVYVYI